MSSGQDQASQVSQHDVTRLLRAWGAGDERALEQLMPLVYEELHRLAHRYMSSEQPGQTLQTTALVHEAYLRLVDVKRVDWQDRAHFYALCARLMRRILVDFARSRSYQKRGGGATHVRLDEAVTVSAVMGCPNACDPEGSNDCPR
jgi:RNA polymerase sigma factor (TIGR02999 family)